MLRTFRAFNTVQKFIFLILTGVFLLSAGTIFWLYREDQATKRPTSGGRFVEGMVGQMQYLNPFFPGANTVDDSINYFLYSGLTRYNPFTRKAEPDLATYTISSSRRKYTFTLKENAKWHDGTPITADDVLFTYSTIQDPAFPNSVLRSTFQEVKVEKTDDRTILFTLPKPYYYFPYSTTVGIVPKARWESVPVENVGENMEYIGSGPYQMERIRQEKGYTQVELTAFDDYYGKKPYISELSFKIFKNNDDLVSNLGTVDGFRNIKEGSVTESDLAAFETYEYTLPQYVALFLNTTSPKLAPVKMRIALSLATNRDEIINSLIPNAHKITTPFLELTEDWKFDYDLNKAQGALLESGWKLPTTATGTAFNVARYLVAENTLSDTTHGRITDPAQNIITNRSRYVLRGTAPSDSTAIIINGYQLNRFDPKKGSWSYVADNSLGNLNLGLNTYRVTAVLKNGQKSYLGQISITYDPNVGTTMKAPQPTDPDPVVPATPTPPATDPTPPAAATPTTTTGTTLPTTVTPPTLPEKILNSAVRYNSKKEPLLLYLVTIDTPNYVTIARYLQREWAKIGIELKVLTYPKNILEEKINNKRILELEDLKKKKQTTKVLSLEEQDRLTYLEKLDSYDIMLYGQNIGYTLDIYPFWHSSQKNGYNLSNYDRIDEALEFLVNPDLDDAEDLEAARTNKLKEISLNFREHMPAIFIYQPVYKYYVNNRLKDVALGDALVQHQDRFSGFGKWYVQESRDLEGFNLGAFFSWIGQHFW